MNSYYNFDDQANYSEGRAFQIVADSLSKDHEKRGVVWTVFFNHELNRGKTEYNYRNVDMAIVSECGFWICEFKSYSDSTMKNDETLLSHAVKQTTDLGRIAAPIYRSMPTSDTSKAQEFFKAHLVFHSSVSNLNNKHKSDQIVITDLSSLVKELIGSPRGKLNNGQVRYLLEELNNGPVKTIPIKNVHLPKFREFKTLSKLQSIAHDFTRIYKAQHLRTKQDVVLFVYDIGYRNEIKDGLALAQRESDVYMNLQKCKSVARVVSQFSQTDFPGEVATFAIEAMRRERSLADKRSYEALETSQRIIFVIECLEALTEIHNTVIPSNPTAKVLHRNLSPKSIYIGTEGLFPVIYDFALAGLDPNSTIVSSQNEALIDSLISTSKYMAPSVLKDGIGSASENTDFYSLAVVLLETILQNNDDPGDASLSLARNEVEKLLANEIYGDSGVRGIIESLQVLCTDDAPHASFASKNEAVDLWDNGTIVSLNSKPSHRYKIITRLGSGSEYVSFRANPLLGGASESQSVVLRVPHFSSASSQSLSAYREAALLDIDGLQRVHEVEEHLVANSVAVICGYVDGFSLEEVPELWIEIAKGAETPFEDLVIDWMLCNLGTLAQLGQQKWILRDISQSNIIVEGRLSTLIDLSGLTREPSSSAYVTPITSLKRSDFDGKYLCVDDFNSLLMCYQQLLEKIFNFDPGDSEGLVIWSNRGEAKLVDLYGLIRQSITTTDIDIADLIPGLERELRRIQSSHYDPNNDHLTSILSFYPGSRFGNSETRGMDEEISKITYIKSRLDELLLTRVIQGDKRLILLLGNAGDGKTAILQNLLGEIYGSQLVVNSRDRIFVGSLDNGREIYVNFDGSASYKNKSSVDMLVEFFEPFGDGAADYDGTRVLAINSGPLHDWVEQYIGNPRFKKLANDLRIYLTNEGKGGISEFSSKLWIIDLNKRSLVGSIDRNDEEKTIVQKMVERMVSPIEGEDAWECCSRCSARTRCIAYSSVRLLRGEADQSPETTMQKVVEIVRIVHLRGKIHITTRFLKGWLSFVFFGTHSCEELQVNVNHRPAPLEQRLFGQVHNTEKLNDGFIQETTQGDIFEEVMALDPGWLAVPILDRGAEGDLPIDQYRRKGYLYQVPKSLELQYTLAGSGDASSFEKMIQAIIDEDNERIQCFLAILLKGLARLDDLPERAFRDLKFVPLRVDTLNPIDIVFWSEIAVDEFSLSISGPVDSIEDSGIDTLPFEVILKHESPRTATSSFLTIDLGTFGTLRQSQKRLHFPPLSGGGGSMTNLRIFLRQLQMHERHKLYVLDTQGSDKIFALTSLYNGSVTQLKISEI